MCKYCYPKNTVATFRNHDTTCMNCGYVFHREETKTIHRGYSKSDKNIHIFQILHPYYCPECGMRIAVFEVPCGGNYYLEFDQNNVEISRGQR